jgi:hypothetical protein
VGSGRRGMSALPLPTGGDTRATAYGRGACTAFGRGADSLSALGRQAVRPVGTAQGGPGSRQAVRPFGTAQRGPSSRQAACPTLLLAWMAAFGSLSCTLVIPSPCGLG